MASWSGMGHIMPNLYTIAYLGVLRRRLRTIQGRTSGIHLPVGGLKVWSRQ